MSERNAAVVRLRHLQRATAGKEINDRFERVIELAGSMNAEERQHLLKSRIVAP